MELKERYKDRTLKVNQWTLLKGEIAGVSKNPINAKVLHVFKRNRRPTRKVVEKIYPGRRYSFRFKKWILDEEGVEKFCRKKSYDRYLVGIINSYKRVLAEPTDHYNKDYGIVLKVMDFSPKLVSGNT